MTHQTVTAKVVRVPILPMKMANAYVLLGEKQCVLVDSGLPGSTPKIERILARHGRTLKDVSALVVTHAHVDHAGNAAQLREKIGGPVIAHAGDLPYYRRERPMSFCPTGPVGRLFFRTPLPHRIYAAFTPEILLRDDETFDLNSFGVPGLIRHTAGHTAGSIIVELPDSQALIGDLAASGIGIGGILRTGHAIRPPFEDDPQSVSRELLRLHAGGTTRFYVGHGGELTAAEIHRHAQTLRTAGVCKGRLTKA